MRNAYAEQSEIAGALRADQTRARTGIGPTVRRTLDLTLATLALVLLSPVWAVIAVAIAIESGGPVLFRQTRVGRDRATFTVYKFRTMHRAADSERHRRYVRNLIEGPSEDAVAEEGGLFKLAVDDRMTKVGRVLRRWSLDELPQLLNVVRGQMSLVGPRPVIPYEVELYRDWYMERFAVKPGMTGLWQVMGRNHRTYEEMVRDDIEYARGESVGLYLRILLKTPWVVLTRRGAA